MADPPLFDDSKTFVDMPMVNSVNDTLDSFAAFLANYPDYTSADLLQWVNDNFSPVGTELLSWTPPDYTDSPAFLDAITDPIFKKFGEDVNAIWPNLGRQMDEKVLANPDQYSIFWIENPFIVPGGRFREFYYWDSYWITLGLLRSEMVNVSSSKNISSFY